MLKKGNFYTIVTAVAVLLFGLIIVQLYWLKDAYRLKEIDYNNRVYSVLEKTIKYVERESFSFNLFGRSYIQPGEGVMVLKAKHGSTTLDTVRLFNSFPYYDRPDTCFYSTAASFYNNLTLVDVTLRFEYRKQDTVLNILAQNNLYSNLAKENFKQALKEHLAVKDRIKIAALDSTLRAEFRMAGISNTPAYGISRAGDTAFELVSQAGIKARLQASPHRISFMNDRAFTQPYELVVWLKDKDDYIRKGLLWSLLVSSAIILLLTGAFIYFFRTVLVQKKLSEMKTDFINNMTHEFMTPVTNISLALETLEKQHSSYTAGERRIVNIIAAENVHLRDNINKVLQVAILEKGSFVLDIVVLDIHELLQRVARSFQLPVAKKNGNISFELSAARDTILADETHILNMFYNILDNAVKYASDKPLLINIRTGNSGKKLWVSIEDNGIGMPPEVQKHSFDKFYRGAKGNVHDVKGFGLGLTYLKSIATAHDIAVELVSIQGKGTTFTFWFNLKA